VAQAAATRRRRSADARGESVSAVAPVYRTFPARIPTSLAVTGGALSALGALGTAIRATRVPAVREAAVQAGVTMGYRDAAGWVIAVLAIELIVLALMWRRGARVLKIAAAGVALASIVLSALRISNLSDRAGAIAASRFRAPQGFVAYHVGLGWGAWVLALGTMLVGFALLVGVLRELDLRKGLPE
jgi:hypothetical protein